MDKRIILIVSTIVIVIAGYFIGQNLYQDKKVEATSEISQEVFERPHSPTLGRADAKVTLVEFLDPECESCRAFYPFVKTMMNKYQGDLRLVIRYVPFHQNSKFVIKVLEAARRQGEEKFWRTLETLFYHQPQWGDHHNPNPELIWTYIPKLDMDVQTIKDDLENPMTLNIIATDMADAQTLGVRATPTFFINGEPLLEFGYQQLETAIQKAIEASNE